MIAVKCDIKILRGCIPSLKRGNVQRLFWKAPSNSYYNKTWRLLLRKYSFSYQTALASGSIILALIYSSVSYTSICAGAESDRLTKSEFADVLRTRLNKVREKIRRRGKSTPNLLFRVDSDSSGKNETHVVELPLSNNMDVLALLRHWTLPLMTNTDPSAPSEKLITSFKNNRKDMVLVSPDKDSSVILETTDRIGNSTYSISLFKDGGFTNTDVDHIVQGYDAALSYTLPPSSSNNDLEKTISRIFRNNFDSLPSTERNNNNGQITEGMEDPIGTLRSMGIEVFDRDSNTNLDWSSLAGYENVKRSIEDTIINALQHPEIYNAVAMKTRAAYSDDCNRPRAVLFEGPPGTGKTLTARIIARRMDKPMIHLSVENITSKWYGDSEKKLTKIFDACEAMDGAIIFIDEIDALATSRDSSSSMHEATRRILSVILQRLDGFSSRGRNLLICATNRKQDLDSALISRFDLTIPYSLPDYSTRQLVFGRYAKHLKASELKDLAEVSQGMSCRDIMEICGHTERQLASQIVRKEVKTGEVPTVSQYIGNIEQRRKEHGLRTDVDL